MGRRFAPLELDEAERAEPKLLRLSNSQPTLISSLRFAMSSAPRGAVQARHRAVRR